MRIEGADKLIIKFDQLPEKTRKRLRRMIKRNTEEGARVARVLANFKTGETSRKIFTLYEPDGMRASVEAAQPNREAQARARSIEHGRKRGVRGTTAPKPFIRPTQEYLGKRFGRSIRRAIKQTMKEVFRG